MYLVHESSRATIPYDRVRDEEGIYEVQRRAGAAPGALPQETCRCGKHSPAVPGRGVALPFDCTQEFCYGWVKFICAYRCLRLLR